MEPRDREEKKPVSLESSSEDCNNRTESNYVPTSGTSIGTPQVDLLTYARRLQEASSDPAEARNLNRETTASDAFPFQLPLNRTTSRVPIPVAVEVLAEVERDATSVANNLTQLMATLRASLTDVSFFPSGGLASPLPQIYAKAGLSDLPQVTDFDMLCCTFKSSEIPAGLSEEMAMV